MTKILLTIRVSVLILNLSEYHSGFTHTEVNALNDRPLLDDLTSSSWTRDHRLGAW